MNKSKIYRSILANSISLVVAAGCLVRWVFSTWPKTSWKELTIHASEHFDGLFATDIHSFWMTIVLPFVLALVLLNLFFLEKLPIKPSKRVCKVFAGIAGISVLAIVGFTYNQFQTYPYYDVEEDGIESREKIREESKAESYDLWEQYESHVTITEDSADKTEKVYSDFIDRNYVDPDEVAITFPSEKRNVIYIYLESMETAYTDKENGGQFLSNCIPNLTNLAQGNEDFSGEDRALNGAISMPDTGWTMAGMFASTSGLPLKTDTGTNCISLQSSFFSGVTTMGDILEDAGYNQALCIGSTASFGGREKYFTEHGNYTILK